MGDRAEGLAFRRLAVRHERAVRRTLASARQAGFRRLNRAAVRVALTHPGRLLSALRTFTDRFSAGLLPLEDTFFSTFQNGWRFGESVVPTQSVKILADADSDVALAAALAWAERYAAELIVDITFETQAAIRELVQRAFRDRVPADELAWLILQTGMLGLTTRQTTAVFQFRKKLLAAAPGTQVTAGSRVFHIPETGITPALVKRWTGQYADRLLTQRARTIARTTTITATAAGQQAAWRVAVNEGRLPSDIRKRWTVAPKPCRICQALDGVEVDLQDEFASDVGLLPYPPAHPNCRCSVVLVQ